MPTRASTSKSRASRGIGRFKRLRDTKAAKLVSEGARILAQEGIAVKQPRQNSRRWRSS